MISIEKDGVVKRVNRDKVKKRGQEIEELNPRTTRRKKEPWWIAEKGIGLKVKLRRINCVSEKNQEWLAWLNVVAKLCAV